MAITSISINFTPCTPAPSGGYNVQYREIGSSVFIDAGNFASSPANITGLDYPDGTEFEGFIRSDCGDGLFGPEVPWTYQAEEELTVHIINLSGSNVVIEDITGLTGYSLSTPLAGGEEEFGTHGDFTGAISATVSGTPISGSLQLYKNGILTDCINVGSAGSYSFVSDSYISTDLIEVRWFGGACPP